MKGSSVETCSLIIEEVRSVELVLLKFRWGDRGKGGIPETIVYQHQTSGLYRIQTQVEINHVPSDVWTEFTSPAQCSAFIGRKAENLSTNLNRKQVPVVRANFSNVPWMCLRLFVDASLSGLQVRSQGQPYQMGDCFCFCSNYQIFYISVHCE